jgi:hypothetical protein
VPNVAQELEDRLLVQHIALLVQTVAKMTLVQIVATMISVKILSTIFLDTTAASGNIVAFYIPLVTRLTS